MSPTSKQREFSRLIAAKEYQVETLPRGTFEHTDIETLLIKII